MNFKILTTGVSTAALLGALGLAYAQTYSSDPAAPSADRATQQAAPETSRTPMSDTTAPSSTMAPSDSSTAAPSDRSTVAPSDSSTQPAMPAPSSDGTMADPAPQPDRG